MALVAVSELTIQLPEISQHIWDIKYRWKSVDGTSNEDTREDSLLRVVNGVYLYDENEEQRSLALDSVLSGYFIPAGRVHSGAGTDKRVTLLNCYVSENIQDSLDTDAGKGVGIMDALRRAAITQQMGGGIGMDFSTLRPKGSIVQRTNSVSEGPLVFMDMWDAMCATIASSGLRRGAMMGTLNVDHPDIWSFIDAKREKGRLTNFNISVLITDDFMEAVEKDSLWSLGFEVPPRTKGKFYEVQSRGGKDWYVYDRVSAQHLWKTIIESSYKYSEPGVIFIDRINQQNNLSYCETITCTNPCGEQPLPPNGACDLGAINLAKMVDDPFGEGANILWDRLVQATQVGVRFLDNVLDVTLFPLAEQKEESDNKRRIGLGVTGLGNMLQMMKLRYGSKESLHLVEKVMRCIRDTAYETSVGLARERGAFPKYDSESFLAAPFIKALPKTIQRKIKQKGIRNGVLLTIAPTGTTSIYFNNISSGIEPTFSFIHDRKVLKSPGEHDTFEVEDYGYNQYRNICLEGRQPNGKGLPSYMVTALELSVDAHLAMQQVCQRYIDASISKTINVPEEFNYEKFQRIYEQAYKTGLKGCTTYRPSAIRGSVLTTKEKKKTPQAVKIDRPDCLDGKTYKLKWGSYNYYVVINNHEIDGRVIPFEIFISTKDPTHTDWITALTRTISSVFRRGGDLTFLPDELKQIMSPQGGQWINQKYCPSLAAYIGETISDHMVSIGYITEDKSNDNGEAMVVSIGDFKVTTGGLYNDPCPSCGDNGMLTQEGCATCQSCGYSKCG